MRSPRRLTLGVAILAAAAAACTPTGTATTAPTGGGAATGPAATATGAAPTTATSAAATTAPATSAPATSAPASAAPTGATATTAPSGGIPAVAFAVFEPKAGTDAVNGGATLFGMGGQTQVVIGVMSTRTEEMAASIQAGTCDNLTPEIAYRLTNLASGASSTSVAVDLATLLATPHAINISVLASETESSITCGEIQAIPLP